MAVVGGPLPNVGEDACETTPLMSLQSLSTPSFGSPLQVAGHRLPPVSGEPHEAGVGLRRVNSTTASSKRSRVIR